jgi:hypothetical protein
VSALSIIIGLIFGLSYVDFHTLLKDVFLYAAAVWFAGFIVAFLTRTCGPQMEGVRPRDFARDFPSPRLEVVLRASAEVILVGALISGTLGGLIVGGISTTANGLHFGIVIAACAAIYMSKNLIGFAVVEQARIRLVLRWTNLLPMPSRKFLAHAAQCLFLQETGDGYMFRHIFIQEFFSELCPPERLGREQNKPDPSRIDGVLMAAQL